VASDTSTREELVTVVFLNWLVDALDVVGIRTWLSVGVPACVLKEVVFDGMLVFGVSDEKLLDGKIAPSEACTTVVLPFDIT